jgi:small subunit ribosomal protein S18
MAEARRGNSSRTSARPNRFMGKRRRRSCQFCVDKNEPVFTELNTLRNFVTSRGKIMAKRQSAVCPKHQRRLATAVKQARAIGLLPYVVD